MFLLPPLLLALHCERYDSRTDVEQINSLRKCFWNSSDTKITICQTRGKNRCDLAVGLQWLCAFCSDESLVFNQNNGSSSWESPTDVLTRQKGESRLDGKKLWL